MPRKVYIKPRSSTQKAFASRRTQRQQKGILRTSFSFSYKVYASTLCVIFAAYAYVFLFSPWFVVTKVTIRVEHGTAQDQQTVENALSQYFMKGESRFFSFQRRLVLVTKGKIASIINQVMTFENVSINREFPHELKVSLVLEAPHVTWREVDGREYYLNASGNVLKAKQEHGVSTDAFLFEKATGTRVALIPGAHVIDREPLEAFEAFREALSQSMRDFSLSKVAYDPTDPQTLNIVTNEGWTIIVDQNTNMASAIATLTKVLRETIGVNRLKLQYVDLRVENKVFYK